MRDFEEFNRQFEDERSAIWRHIFVHNRDAIRIKKEKFALPALQVIITSTLDLSNRSSFRAMSLRDLSSDTGISMGSLYSYIESKERLLAMILGHVLHLVEAVLGVTAAEHGNPRECLHQLVRRHVFLTEVMQPWFFFAYMEAKSFDKWGKQLAIASELRTEALIAACLAAGQASGIYRAVDPVMVASLTKPLLQDWYLKRWKYRRRVIGPDAYADWDIDFVEAFMTAPDLQSRDGAAVSGRAS